MTRQSSTCTESSTSKRDRHEREGGCALPGEILHLAAARQLPGRRLLGTNCKKSAEVILRLSTRAEGPNLKLSGRGFDHDGEGGVAIEAGMPRACAPERRRNRRNGR